MRQLIVIPHYCAAPGAGPAACGSQGPSLPRIAALSEAIQKLFEHFGPRRVAGRSHDLGRTAPGKDVLDVVIVTKRDANILDHIDLDRQRVSVEYFDGPPPMLIFETQRVVRERSGQYDLYGMMEDDLVIHDPLFFDKIRWFASFFPENCLLQPHRYEISKSGRIAKFLIEPKFQQRPDLFTRPGQTQRLKGDWRGFPVALELMKILTRGVGS